eukprot:TRINITY_DN66948_c0_g1_i2.p1 TRINITY_DN66948_c0_g1~~TRINITY_DN66948_c0_g1_i2.p1  ORF type:complete len:1225 (+),score=179.63 TRINITY_DN66948_c0_g1_i2:692-4366(+)
MWPGVKCHDNKVIWLDLSRNNLQGQFPDLGNPASSAYLADLIVLRLVNNTLSGPIPFSLPHPVLQVMQLGYAPFTGGLPNFVFPSLTVLKVFVTDVGGNLSPLLLSSPNLRVVDLHASKLVGGIPNTVAVHPKITTLFLNNNLLTGSLPVEFTIPGPRRALRLDTNNLDGLLNGSTAYMNTALYLDKHITLGNNKWKCPLPHPPYYWDDLELTSCEGAELVVFNISNTSKLSTRDGDLRIDFSFQLTADAQLTIRLTETKFSEVSYEVHRPSGDLWRKDTCCGVTCSIPYSPLDTSGSILGPVNISLFLHSAFAGKMPGATVSVVAPPHLLVTRNLLTGPVNLDVAYVPQLLTVNPNVGFLSGGEVTIHGRGFLASLQPKCVFYSTKTNTTGTTFNVTRHSDTLIVCQQPPFVLPLPEPSYVAVSLYNETYTDPIAYSIIGPVVRLVVDTTPPKLRTALVLQFNPITIVAMDAVGHKLSGSSSIDLGAHNVQCRFVAFVPGEESGSLNFSYVTQLFGCDNVTSNDGTFKFTGITMLSPPRGWYQFVFQDTTNPLVRSAALEVEVLGEARPDFIELRPPYPKSVTLWDGHVETVTLYFRGASGNMVTNLAGWTVRAIAVSPCKVASGGYAKIASGIATFGSLQVDVSFNTPCNVTFQAYESDYPSLNVLSLVFYRVKCVSEQMYAIPGNSTCLPCGAGMSCDGTSLVKVAKGYWRAEEAKALDPASYVACSKDVEPCLGSAGNVTSLCVEGHTGRLCAMCQSGYAKSAGRCKKCSQRWLTIFLVVIVALASLIIVILLVHLTIKEAVQVAKMEHVKASDEESATGLLSSIIKQALSYMQSSVAVGEVDVNWPSLFDSLYRFERMVTSFNLSIFSSISCVIELGLYQMLLIFVFFPVCCALPLVIVGMFRLQKQLNVDEERRRAVRLQRLTSVRSYCIVACTVGIFLMHPMLMEQLAKTFKCTPPINDVTYLEYDPRLECQGPTYNAYKALAVVASLVYGLALPGAIMFALQRNRERLNKPYFFARLGFLYKEYEPHAYFWEIVLAIKKTLMMFIVVLAADPDTPVYQITFLMWILAAELSATMYFEPNSPQLQNAEIAGQIANMVKLSCAYLFMPNSEALKPAATVLVFAIMLAADITVVFCILFSVRKHLFDFGQHLLELKKRNKPQEGVEMEEVDHEYLRMSFAEAQRPSPTPPPIHGSDVGRASATPSPWRKSIDSDQRGHM